MLYSLSLFMLPSCPKGSIQKDAKECVNVGLMLSVPYYQFYTNGHYGNYLFIYFSFLNGVTQIFIKVLI